MYSKSKGKTTKKQPKALKIIEKIRKPSIWRSPFFLITGRGVYLSPVKRPQRNLAGSPHVTTAPSFLTTANAPSEQYTVLMRPSSCSSSFFALLVCLIVGAELVQNTAFWLFCVFAFRGCIFAFFLYWFFFAFCCVLAPRNCQNTAF